MLAQNKRLSYILLTIGMLLLIPFIAMQFTDEVNWGPLDFMVMGTLLLGAGLLSDLTWRKIKNVERRYVILAAILILFLITWAELGVGIFGTPFAGD